MRHRFPGGGDVQQQLPAVLRPEIDIEDRGDDQRMRQGVQDQVQFLHTLYNEH